MTYILQIHNNTKRVTLEQGKDTRQQLESTEENEKNQK